ncbi:hypothetical protein ACFQZS_14030 [Mucilaginibacter calamicampi]|uniref:Helicase ATP-binding domain-containing protein n=1 Tax=Mucilaginibacter calamicampi TaxID=1302352 RepID=A0ABW2Z3J2_9SPHI
MKITNIEYDRQIPFDSKTTKYFTDIVSVYPIPAYTILYKTITGIGATFGEIKANRHSIIVLPHISIVKSKQEQHKLKDDTFAVYHKVSIKQVLEYLVRAGAYKKFLTTPKGLDKILKALKVSGHDLRENDFFLLIDEQHKYIQDATYRADMVNVMERFFTFKSKAMISATPIPPSDPRFEMQGFEHVLVRPTDDYKRPIKLVHTDSIANSVKEYIDSSTAKHICVFYNTVDGIVGLIDELNVENYMIFCSELSTVMLKVLSDHNVSHDLRPLSKINFFTSSFFNGLDVYDIDNDVDVLLISDVGFRTHTELDPYTDVLQIIGRFRKKYKRAVHFNNCKSVTRPLTEEEVKDNIAKSKAVYEAISILKNSYVHGDLDIIYDQALNAIRPYSNFIDERGNFNHFLLDNYLDDCRISRYYTDVSSLKKAYLDTNLYHFEEDREPYKRSERIKMAKDTLKYRATNIELIADKLLELEDFKSSDAYEEQRDEILEMFPITFDGYERLGYDRLVELEFEKKEIVKALLKDKVDVNMIAYPVIECVNLTFFPNQTYSVAEIKIKLQEIYDEYKVPAVAKGTDILFYFHADENFKGRGKNRRAFDLKDRKFNSVKQYQRV